MCVISCILKLVISIVNSLLMIIGIVLTVIGALLLWGMNFFLKNIYDLEAQFQSFISKIGIPSASSSGIFSLMQQNANSIGAIAFGVGIVLIALAILGIIAVCCCSLKKILIVICIFLIALTLGLIVLIAYYGVNSSDKVFTPLSKLLQTDFINKYKDFNSTDPESLIVNIIQISVNCCGLYKFSDFNTAPNFNRFAYDSNSKLWNITFPVTCCDYKNDFTITKDSRDYCIQNNNSTKINNGCWTTVLPQLQTYFNYCLGTIGITIGILVATIIVSIILIKCADKLE